MTTSTEAQHADPFPANRDAWLLMEFIGALERNIHSAAEGSVERPQLPQSVLAFFVANRKAGILWLTSSLSLFICCETSSLDQGLFFCPLEACKPNSQS